MAAECVVVLVSTPFAVRNKQNADRINAVGQAESRAIFKASDFRLRASDVNYIVELFSSCRFKEPVQHAFDHWKKSGFWTEPGLQVIGAAKLRLPRGLRNMGTLASREDFVLWHAWGRPSPHEAHPQMLLFHVVDSTCFEEPLDFRAYSSSLRVAEQRTSWVVNLPEAQLSMLKASGCNRARSFEECLQQWGVRNIPKSFVVFTSLGQILHLLVRQKWAVLPDMARCTPRLIRFPKGGQGSLSLSQD